MVPPMKQQLESQPTPPSSILPQPTGGVQAGVVTAPHPPWESLLPAPFPQSEYAKPWRRVVAEAIRDPDELCGLLRLPTRYAETARKAGGTFPLLLPRTLLPRIQPGDPNDPVLRQFLAAEEELTPHHGFTRDPLAECIASPVPRVLAKYPTRLLMLTVGGCPVHCRYCFRRHLPYDELIRSPSTPRGSGSVGIGQDAACGPARGSESQPDQLLAPETLRFLESRTDCKEVILSGGEPLLLEDSRLESLIHRISQIPHISRIRIHTRMPVVIPQRVTGGFLAAMKSTRLTPIVVLHVNHPQELDNQVANAASQMADAGIPLLSQGVLLAGINDRVEVLRELYDRLADIRVIPYYLHQLDRVEGAGHFEVPVHVGRGLIDQLRAVLPGYMVPKYVRESPDVPYKVPLA